MKNPFAVQGPILVSIGVETKAVLQTKGGVIYACAEREMAMNRTARNLNNRASVVCDYINLQNCCGGRLAETLRYNTKRKHQT
jgi:hypothetical protein